MHLGCPNHATNAVPQTVRTVGHLKVLIGNGFPRITAAKNLRTVVSGEQTIIMAVDRIKGLKRIRRVKIRQWIAKSSHRSFALSQAFMKPINALLRQA